MKSIIEREATFENNSVSRSLIQSPGKPLTTLQAYTIIKHTIYVYTYTYIHKHTDIYIYIYKIKLSHQYRFSPIVKSYIVELN